MSKLCQIVWDGKSLIIPDDVGKPRDDQMQGSDLDRLTEMSGRVCYNSLGKGRNSVDYHKHIAEVGHFSIQEHGNLTFTCQSLDVPAYLSCVEVLLNRPGVWATKVVPVLAGVGFELRITMNLRAIREWFKYPKANRYADLLGNKIQHLAKQKAPLTLFDVECSDNPLPLTVGTPKFDEETWVSLFITNVSRGLTHELVRHRTGVSQRCLAGDTMVKFAWLNGETGKPNNYKEYSIERLYGLHPTRLSKMHAYVLDEQNNEFTFSKIRKVLFSGKKPCFKITLKNGKKLKCTKDHKILTDQGWKTLEDIASVKLSTNNCVVWNKDTNYNIACNGKFDDPLYTNFEWLYEMYHVQRLSLEEIAKLAGCNARTIHEYVNRFNIPLKGRNPAGTGDYRNAEWLKTHYQDMGLSLYEMSTISECSSDVIRTWLRRFGLQKKRGEINLGNVPWNKGLSYNHTKPYSAESIERYRQSKTGEKNPHWKGGITGGPRLKFQSWKHQNPKTIYERDGYRCRLCNRSASDVPKCGWTNRRGRTLEINHIVPMWLRPDLCCDPNNMILLCWECHAKKVTGHELEYVSMFTEMIQVPVPYIPKLVRPGNGPKKKRPTYSKIVKIEYVGEINTYDLEMEEPHHNFVANGIVVHNSTRYVPENESPWCWHPLIKLADNPELTSTFNQREAECKEAYKLAVFVMEDYLTKLGVDRLSARKQARGAARGVLGNALFTELVFSANIAHWKHMIRMRASKYADAEIRLLFNDVFNVLKNHYPERFQGWEETACDDGMGFDCVERKVA